MAAKSERMKGVARKEGVIRKIGETSSNVRLLEAERYSGIPGVRRIRNRIGCDLRKKISLLANPCG